MTAALIAQLEALIDKLRAPSNWLKQATNVDWKSVVNAVADFLRARQALEAK